MNNPIKLSLEQKQIDILEFLVNENLKSTTKAIKDIDEGNSTVIGPKIYREIYSKRVETYESILVGLQTREYRLK